MDMPIRLEFEPDWTKNQISQMGPSILRVNWTKLHCHVNKCAQQQIEREDMQDISTKLQKSFLGDK